LRLSIIKSISWSKLVGTRVRVGGCGWKSTTPKMIWFPSIFVLLLDESKKAVKFIIPTPKLPTVDANLWGFNSANVLDEGLRIGGRGRRMNSDSDEQGKTWCVLKIS
jgi:hypothetical protein